MARVSIADLASEAIEVDLWENDGGGLFKTRPLTRSLSRKFDEFMDRIEKAEGDDNDAAFGLLGELLDLITVPANGGKAKASTVLKRKWEQDKAELPQVLALVEGLAQELGAPPPSATKT